MITANRVFRRCVDLARQHGLGRIEVANLPMVPCTTLLLNEHERAAEAEIAIEAAARAGAHRAEIVARQVAGQILLDMAELQRARLCMETALAAARRLGARRFEAESLMFLGAIEHAAGRRPEARRLAVEHLPSTARPE
ncbi:MAG: hypothetical protein U1E53_21255 [Dongiaceae bacterium]